MRVRLRIINEAKREENSIKHSLEVMLTHMLKCKYQYDYPYKPSWRDSIWNSYSDFTNEFIAVGKGSLYNSFYMKKFDLDSVYQKALNRAVRETRLPKEVFPEYCEWTKKELSDLDFISNFIEEYGYGPNEKD